MQPLLVWQWHNCVYMRPFAPRLQYVGVQVWARARKRYLREAEEEGRGSDEERGGCRHRDISAGTKWTGRSRSRDTYSSPNPATTEARHQRDRVGRKTEREVGIYGLPTGNDALQVKMANVGLVWEEGPWLQTRKKKTLCKAATEWKHEGFCVQTLNVSWH